MFALLSPAKKLDFSPSPKGLTKTAPPFPEDTAILVKRARRYSKQALRDLMGISEDLANLNHERFKAFDLDGGGETKQAALAFAGDVYVGLDAPSLSKADLKFAQTHLGILSGLYGLLRPLDAIQPYRLEMGSAVDTKRGGSLYDFWRETLTEEVKERLEGLKSPALINLASKEYFSAVNAKALGVPVIEPAFKELRNGKRMMISFFAKKARGLMARYMIVNRITDPEKLKAFDYEGYRFDPKASSAKKWEFVRASDS